MINNLLFNIKYELNELRYSTELPIVIIAIPIAIVSVGAVVYELVRAIVGSF
jgi:hypothetical protein